MHSTSLQCDPELLKPILYCLLLNYTVVICNDLTCVLLRVDEMKSEVKCLLVVEDIILGKRLPVSSIYMSSLVYQAIHKVGFLYGVL